MRRGERNKRKRWEYQETDRWLVLKPEHFSAHSQRIYLLQRVLQTKNTTVAWSFSDHLCPWALPMSTMKPHHLLSSGAMYFFLSDDQKGKNTPQSEPFSIGLIYGNKYYNKQLYNTGWGGWRCELVSERLTYPTLHGSITIASIIDKCNPSP